MLVCAAGNAAAGTKLFRTCDKAGAQQTGPGPHGCLLQDEGLQLLLDEGLQLLVDEGLQLLLQTAAAAPAGGCC
jgi:hypothetical protein